MSRFQPRPPRRTRGVKSDRSAMKRVIPARRNTFDLSDLARLDNPTLLVLPVGYQAVRAAAELYRTLDKAQEALGLINTFVEKYDKYDKTIAVAVYPEGDFDKPDEMVLLDIVFRMNHVDVYGAEAQAASAGQPGFEIEDISYSVGMTKEAADIYLSVVNDEELSELAEKLEPLLGEVTVAHSLVPLPSLGLLSGEGLDLVRVRLGRRIRDIVLDLDKKLQMGSVANTPQMQYALTKDPNSWKSVVPTEVVGPHFTESGTEVGRAIFAVVGKANEPIDLFPMTDMMIEYPDANVKTENPTGQYEDYRRLTTSAVVEGILRHSIEMGLWRLTGFNHYGDQQWGWKGNLQFAYPMEVAGDKENDPPITGKVGELINFIQAPALTFRGTVNGDSIHVDTTMAPNRAIPGRAVLEFGGESYRLTTRSDVFRDGKGYRLNGRDIELYLRVPRSEEDTALIWGSFRHKGREIKVPFTQMRVEERETGHVAPGFAHLLVNAAQALRAEANTFPSLAAGFLASSVEETVFDTAPVMAELSVLLSRGFRGLSLQSAQELLIRGGTDPLIVDEWLRDNKIASGLEDMTDEQRAALIYGLRPYQYQGAVPVLGRAVASDTRNHFLSWYGQRRMKVEGPLKARMQNAYLRMAVNLGSSQDPGALSMAEDAITKRLPDPFAVPRLELEPPLATPGENQDLALAVAARMMQSQLLRKPELDKAMLARFSRAFIQAMNEKVVTVPSGVQGQYMIVDLRVAGNPIAQMFAPLTGSESKLLVAPFIRQRSGEPIPPTDKIDLNFDTFAQLMAGQKLPVMPLNPNQMAALGWINPYEIMREVVRIGSGVEPVMYVGFKPNSMPKGRIPELADRHRLDLVEPAITYDLLSKLSGKKDIIDTPSQNLANVLGNGKYVVASSASESEPFKVFELKQVKVRMDGGQKFFTYTVEYLPPLKAAGVLRAAERRAREAYAKAQEISNSMKAEVQVPFDRLAEQVQEIPVLRAFGHEVGADGVPRAMPIEGPPPSWFGSSDVKRSLALMSVRHRADLLAMADENKAVRRHQYAITGLERRDARPRSWLYIMMLQGLNPKLFESVDEDLATTIRNVQGKAKPVRAIAEGLNMNLYEGMTHDEQIATERTVFKQVHDVQRKAVSLPIMETSDRLTSGVMRSAVFTIYGYLDEAAREIMESRGSMIQRNPGEEGDKPARKRHSLKEMRALMVPAEYGIFWQSQPMTIADMRRIVERVANTHPEPEPLADVDLSQVELMPVDYAITPEDARLALRGTKTLDIQSWNAARKTKLGPGEVGRYGDKNEIYVRFRGNKRLDDVLLAFNEEDASTAFERLIEAAFPAAYAKGIRTRNQLVPTIVDPAIKQWMTGLTKLPVYDLAVTDTAIVPFQPIQNENSEFNPSQALLSYIAEESKLLELCGIWARREQDAISKQKGEEPTLPNPAEDDDDADLPSKKKGKTTKLKLPFMVVGTMMVNRREAQACKIKDKLPKSFRLGDSELGLMLTQFRLPTPAGSLVPRPEALYSPYTPDWMPNGLVPKHVSPNDIAKLSANFVKVSYVGKANDYRLVPQVGTGEEGPNPFSYSNLLRVSEFRDLLNENLMEREEEAQVKPEEGKKAPKVKSLDAVADETYIQFLRQGYGALMGGLVESGAKREHAALIGGRRGYAGEREAYRGTGRRISGGAQKGAMISPDRTSKIMITKQSTSFSDTFAWVERLLDSVGMISTKEARATTAGLFPGLRRHRTVKLPLTEEQKGALLSNLANAPEGESLQFELPRRGIYASFQEGERIYTEIESGGHKVVLSLAPLSVTDDKVVVGIQEEEEMPTAGAAASHESEEDSRLASLMDMYGITVEPKEKEEEQLEAMRDALLRLKAAMVSGYDYRMSTGVLLPQLREKQEETDDQEELTRLGFTESFLRDIEEIAKNNPRNRYGRRPRRARRSRHNPMDPADVDTLVQWSERQDDPEAAQRAEGVLARVRRTGADQWPVAPAAIAEMFPREGRARKLWSPAERLRVLQNYDLISRLAPAKVDQLLQTIKSQTGQAITLDQLRDAVNSPDSILGTPEFNNIFLTMFKDQFGLTLEEALKVLEAQYARSQSERTIPASAALTKMYRARRLKDYELPASVRNVIGNRDTLMWMSPIQVSSPRVMTYKRGSHVDADMVAKNRQESLSELLARSVRSVLYWIAEKPTRRQDGNIWIGRCGDPFIYLVWKPGSPLNVNQIAATLQSAIQSPDSGNRRPIYANEAARVADVRAFTQTAKEEKPVSMEVGEEVPLPQAEPKGGTPPASEPAPRVSGELRARVEAVLSSIDEDSILSSEIATLINDPQVTGKMIKDLPASSIPGWKRRTSKWGRLTEQQPSGMPDVMGN